MKTVIYPGNITLTALDGSPIKDAKPVSMYEFVCGMLSDPQAVKDFKCLVKSMKVREAFLNKLPGEEVSIEDADWDHICAIAKEPTGGYTANVYSLRPFIDAILEAK